MDGEAPLATKLLMTWDVLSGSEEEYFEFVVNEFIPQVSRLGLSDIQLWYTSYSKGGSQQILASGVTRTPDQMHGILHSTDWEQLSTRLEALVSDFNQKLISATRGFQI